MLPSRYAPALLAVCFALLLIAVVSQADVIVQEPFTGDALPSGFSLASGASARAPTYTPSGIEFAGDGDNARNYVRTDAADFHDTHLVAYLTVETQLGVSFNLDSQLFFGLGSGVVGGYGVPDRGEAHGLYLNLNHQPGGLAIFYTTPSAHPDLATPAYIDDADQDQVTTTAVRMIYNPDTGTVAYAVDFEYAGDATYADFVADQTIGPVDVPAVLSTAWAEGAPARIVFGGDSDTNSRLIVRDLYVIPEPATMGLLALGGMALIRRRLRN